MAAELCAPERIYLSDGVRFRITPKTRAGSHFEGETIKEKLGRSPDRADAVVYLHHATLKARDFESAQYAPMTVANSLNSRASRAVPLVRVNNTAGWTKFYG